MQTQGILLLAMIGTAAVAATVAENPIVSRHAAQFDKPPQHVPTHGMVDGPLLGNGDLGVVVAGPPEAQQFHLGKNDFSHATIRASSLWEAWGLRSLHCKRLRTIKSRTWLAGRFEGPFPMAR